MNKWLILHNQSRFSEILKRVLGKQAISVHLDTLVNHVSVRASVDHKTTHQWVISGQLVDDFYQRIIFQEVFFSFERALHQYDKLDHQYVKNSWQAYLLSLFSYAKVVINPMTPQNLSASYYQFPRLLALGDRIGFKTPEYEIGGVGKPGYKSLDSLWYWPDRSHMGKTIMNVKMTAGEERVIYFVRYDDSFIVCWPSLPIEMRQKLLLLCNDLGVYIGEAYFQKGKDWVFYGLRPQIQTYRCEDAILLEVAKCVRDIGNEEII